MQAVVLAGGFGTRLRDVVVDCPKPMAPVAGRPFLEILLSSLARKGFRRVVLSLGYMAEKIVNHFGDSFAGMSLVYEIEQTPLGTGGALRQALLQCQSDHAFVFNGDTYIDIDAASLEAAWLVAKSPIIVAREVPDVARYGRLGIDANCVTSFAEKGESGPGLINAGCYVLPTDILNDFVLGQPFSLENDFLAVAVKNRRVDLFVTNGYFIDIGVPDDYVRAQTELAGIFP